MNKGRKKIIVSVTSDLVTDNRVHKVCSTLKNMGFSVVLVGRITPVSLPLRKRNYLTRRLHLPFYKGPLFYASYNIRLFFFLLFSNFDVLLANDLDTLPANYIISKIKGKPLIYDSHEYFTEVPELVSRPKVKEIWEWLEKKMVPHLQYAYTVNESLARIFFQKYGVIFKVVRNLPVGKEKLRPGILLQQRTEKLILYQGAVNVNRGLEQVIMAMKHVEGARLVIAGDGDVREKLEKLVADERLQQKVQFLGRVPFEELSAITSQANLGISVEEDIGLNYHYALPNKLFDYIQAEIPVLVSDLPEMSALVRHYNVGRIIFSLEPVALSEILTEVLSNQEQLKAWKENLKKAARELTWENEEKTLQFIFSKFL